MALSLIDIITEQNRQAATGDYNYAKRGPWVFRLVAPRVAATTIPGPGGASAVFPLPVAPDRFEYTLPFASEITPRQEGGVTVERGGIVLGDIAMSASTGFRLRKNRYRSGAAGVGRFTGQLAEGSVPPDAEISGQLAFWMLANRCFEAYSAMVKDPEIASKTRMELHVIQDQLHLEVEPVSFRLTRTAQSERVTYRFEAELKVLGEAEEFVAPSADERNLLDRAIDTIATIRSNIQAMAATIDDLTAVVGELSRVVSSAASIITDAARIFKAGSDLVNAVTSTFQLPQQFLENFAEQAESAAEFMEDLEGVPDDARQAWHNLVEAADAIKVAARHHYTEPWRDQVDRYNAQTEVGLGADQDAAFQSVIDEAASAGAGAGGTLSLDQAFGADAKPGDAKRQTFSAAERRMDGSAYNGFLQRTVGQGDTLQSLAAKHLLDARKWIDLAVVNGLKPPYVTTGAKIPGTLAPGDSIVIPISNPTQPRGVLTTGETSNLAQEPAEVALGVDYELVRNASGRYTWAVDVRNGRTDCRKVGGVKNLAQGLQSRLRTVQGEAIMTPELGVPRTIGSRQFDDDVIETNLRIRQQVLADPRVERLLGFSLVTENDAIAIEMQVSPVGFDTSRILRAPLT